MTDRLGARLRDAGDLLDRWREDGIGRNGTEIEDDVVVRLVALDERRATGVGRSRLALGAAAAALVLIGGAVAVLASRSSDDSTSVIAGPTAPSGTVMLVPDPDREGILIGSWAGEGASWPSNQAIAVPDDADGDPNRTVQIEQVPALALGSPVAEPASGHGLTGMTWQDPRANGRVLLIDPPVDAERTIRLTAAPSVSVENLLTLASQLDATATLEAQHIGGGWRLIGPAELDASTQTTRDWNWEPAGEGGTWGLATSGGPPERATLAHGYGTTYQRVIRGQDAWVTVREHGWAHATWTEPDGLVVTLTVSPFEHIGEEALIDRLVEVGESLVAVDQAGWDAFATTGFGSPPDPAPSDAAESPAIEVALPGGGELRLYQVLVDEALCWNSMIDGNGSCDHPRLYRTEPEGSTPRLALDHRRVSVAAYGWLAEGASAVEVRFTDGSIVSGEVGHGMWAVAHPEDVVPAAVVYLNGDGEVVETHDRFTDPMEPDHLIEPADPAR